MGNRGWTLNHGITLVTEECCTCGIVFGMPKDFEQQCRTHPGVGTGKAFHCPNGHKQWYTGKNLEQKLKDAEVRQQALTDQLHAAESDAEATRRRLLRERHRFASGVCPCCNRSFENVRRHVASQHPDYDSTVLAARPGYKCSCGRSFESLRGLHTHQGHMRPADWADPKRSTWSRHLTVTS